MSMSATTLGGRSAFIKLEPTCHGVSFREAIAVAFELVRYCTPPLHLLDLHAVRSARVRT